MAETLETELPRLRLAARRPPWLNLVPVSVAAATILTIAVGLIAKAAGASWGTPLQPLFLDYRPAVSGWAVLSVLTLGGALLFAWWLLRADVGALRFGIAALALSLASRLALNMMRSGPDAWYQVFAVHGHGEGRDEYLPALPQVEKGIGHFLGNFADLVPTLPVHAAGNPPGLLLSLDVLGIHTAQGLAALTIAVGALATPALYLLARQLTTEQGARVATLLFVFVPTSLLYGATSADAMYVTFAVVAAALLISRRALVVALGAVALAVASFFSYALLAAGAWSALVVWRRHGVVRALRVAALCAAVLLAFYLAIYAFTGFDLIAVIQATNERYREGIASTRPYLFYLFGSPAVFLLMLGPVAWFAARALGAGEETALALAVVIAVSALGGYTKGETERIWFFYAPFACLAAARVVAARRTAPLLALMTGQAVATELLVATRW